MTDFVATFCRFSVKFLDAGVICMTKMLTKSVKKVVFGIKC